MRIDINDIHCLQSVSEGGAWALKLTVSRWLKVYDQLHDACKAQTPVFFNSGSCDDKSYIVSSCVCADASPWAYCTLIEAIGCFKALPAALTNEPTAPSAPAPALTQTQEAAHRAILQPQHRRAGLLGLDSVQD